MFVVLGRIGCAAAPSRRSLRLTATPRAGATATGARHIVAGRPATFVFVILSPVVVPSATVLITAATVLFIAAAAVLFIAVPVFVS
jgi:hypothetical protein